MEKGDNMSGFGSMLNDYLEYHKISQTEFADRLGISQKHMNEIINDKTNLSVDLIIAISLLTNIDVNLIYYVENKKKIYNELISKYGSEKDINKMLDSYCLKEMEEKGWIRLKDKKSFTQKYMDLIEFLNVKDISTFDSYLDKRFLFKKKDNSNNIKIYLWINHCDKMINDIDIGEYDSNRLSELLLELKDERMKKYNEENLIKLFHKYGIVLYIEDALKGSKVRGCSRVKINTPVIYLTRYLKEKSSLYFTLYHELMHIKKDYNMLKNKTIVDEDEKEIDELALNEMIPKDIYNELLLNVSDRERIAKENKIPLSFLYTRMAMEGKIKYSSSEYLSHREIV